MAKFKKARIDGASSSTPQTVESERWQPYGSNKISDCLFMLHEPAPPHITSMDIIFFHGLQFERNSRSDAYLSTWRSGDAMQEVWPQKWLPAKYPGARIISVSYDAYIGTTGKEGMMDMYLIGESLLEELLRVRGNQGKECPVILVGHSFGGLVIKQLCVHADDKKDTQENGEDIQKFLESIRGIFFYATPHRGMNTTVWQDLAKSSMPANKHLLRFLDGFGKDSARLHENFENRIHARKTWKIYGAGELHVMKGLSNLLVVEASSRFGSDNYVSVESDHFSICRPVSKTSTGYLHLVNLIDEIYDQKSKDERTRRRNQVSDSLFMLYQPAPLHITSMNIIFFHGLQFERNSRSDAYLSTWRSGDAMQEVWPQKWLPAEYPRARIISVSYDAYIGTTGKEGMMDMHLIGENLLEEILRVRKRQEKECPVILVGHSFGGLVIKQLCVYAGKNKNTLANGEDIHKFLESIRGIFFYATPHLGMNTAVWQDLAMRSMPANKPLLSFVEQLGKDPARLHDDFVKQWNACKTWKIYGAGELHAMKGQSSLLVEEASSRFGDKYVSVRSDHVSICRPVSKTSNGYLHLVDLIDEIYDHRSKDERRNQEKVSKNVVGVESQLAEVQQLLQRYAFFGFCGMGGVGKTTMAKLVFNTLSTMFEFTCFVSEVKLIQGNKKEIKEKIWNNMRARRDGHFVSFAKGTCADTWMEVSGKKLLVVFDDIDELKHAELLQEIADENASVESRFIATSRDAQVLRFLHWIYIYTVPFLNPKAARELFITHAFPGGKEPPEGLKQNAEEVVEGCAGLPLTLEVLGKYLQGKTSVRIWDDILVAIRNAVALNPLEEGVWRKLKLSYDDLGDPEKHMFLDIASFLLLESCPFSFEDVRTAWSSMFKCVDMRWQTLVDRSLVQEEITPYPFLLERLMIKTPGEESTRVQMHEHLRRMGERIAKESPGRYVSMMDNQWGTNPIQADKVVALRADFSLHSHGDVHRYRSDSNSSRSCPLEKFFSQLTVVHYLDLVTTCSPCDRCTTSGGFPLPAGLIMLHWEGTNVNVKLPLDDSVCRSLVVLRLYRDDDCFFDILSPQACGYMSRLQRLTLTCSELVRLPDTFGNLSSLEQVKIYKCGLLGRLPESFGNLGKLRHLDIEWCVRLEGLPGTFGTLGSLKHIKLSRCERLKQLPESFGDLGSLRHLEIKLCGLLERLPESFGNLGNLRHLEIEWCKRLKGLPGTFGNLISLEHLEIRQCGLQRLPETFGNLGSLRHINLSWCEEFKQLPETFGSLKSLEHLEIRACDLLERLPETFGNLGNLKRFELEWCKMLEELPKNFGNLGNLKHLRIIECQRFKGLEETLENLRRLELIEIR